MKNRMHKGIAAGGLTAFSIAVLTLSVFHLDSTNYGTANGLFKSIYLKQYIHHADQIDYQELDELSYVANLLYFPTYSAVLKALPFENEEGFIVFEMAVVNAIFGGVSIGALYLLVFAFRRKHLDALLASTFQLGCATFIVLSTNSEDIIAAYCCFVFSSLFLVRYFLLNHYRELVLGSLFFGLSWLFHWTMIVGSSVAVVCALCFYHGTWLQRIKSIALFSGVNLVLLILFAELFNAEYIQLLTGGIFSFKNATLISTKAVGTGWVGWQTEKFITLFMGFPNYILGGFIFHGKDHFLDSIMNFWYLPSFLVSCAILLFVTVAVVSILFKAIQLGGSRLAIAIYFVVLFIVAEAMNAYELANDLQFHLQPLIWIPIVYSLSAATLVQLIRNKSRFVSQCLIWSLLLLPAGMYAYNLKHYLETEKGLDLHYQRAVEQVARNISLEESLFVMRGWTYFGNWANVYTSGEFENNRILLVDFLIYKPEDSTNEAIDRLKTEMSAKFSGGTGSVIAGPELLDRSIEEIEMFYEGFNQDEKLNALIHFVREECKWKLLLNSEIGNFYQLESMPD